MTSNHATLSAVLAAQEFQFRVNTAHQFRMLNDAQQKAGQIESLFAEELRRQTFAEVMTYLQEKLDSPTRLELDGRTMTRQERELLLDTYRGMLGGDLEGLGLVAAKILADEQLASRIVRETATDFSHAPFLLVLNLDGSIGLSLQSVDGDLVFFEDGSYEIQVDAFSEKLGSALPKLSAELLMGQIAQDEMKFQGFMLRHFHRNPF